ELLRERDGEEGFRTLAAGDGSIWYDGSEQFEKDISRGEGIGLPVALIVPLIVFGAGVAAGVPVIAGILGILLAVGMTGIASQFIGIDTNTVSMITMIGLAVGIDYTLFSVERFREERVHGAARVDAIVNAGGT